MDMSDAVITVTIPSDTRFVALARLTGAGLGAELDFDVDTIDDLRMATNELVAVVVEWAATTAATPSR
jgi:anti-sigma regulatory factor (Ser/Thr protein kinase)